MAANMLVMQSSDHIAFQLQYLQDASYLMLCWRSTECIVHSTSSAINHRIDSYLALLVVLLTDRDSALWQSQAQWSFCSGRSHSIKICTPSKMIHIAYHTQCINQYLWATAEYCPIQCAKIKFSVKLCNQPGANSLTPAVLRFLDPLTASHCHCADIHQHQFRLVPWWSCGRMNLWPFGVVLISHSCWVSECLMTLSCSISHWLSASQSSSQSFGLSKS